MAKALVIVESPTKIKTISKILGTKFKVASSMGHLIDLPKSTLGVDVEHAFEPKLIVVRAKQKVLAKLKKDAKPAKDIYVATDPDREGEAIGWNIVQHIDAEKKNVYRVSFQEITKSAVSKAFKNPRKFDQKKIKAQTARRILDRIVGYKISPVLWKKVGSRLSAGRVQSVALRLIVDRDRDIEKFVPKEFWKIGVDLNKEGTEQVLTANLEKINGENFELQNDQAAGQIVDQLKQETFAIEKITERQIRKNPLPPFITSTMQQESFNKLGFNAHRTMVLAQQLYEGIELKDKETVGLITYMRTDSVNISQEALTKLRDFIKNTHGEKYLPEKPNVYKSKKSAQEAHEAIRPTDLSLTPDEVRPFLEEDQYKLYTLIWKRFVASQMEAAIYLNKKLDIRAGHFQLGASGSVVVFDGFMVVTTIENDDENKTDFSLYQEKDPLKLVEVKPTQHFTKPPPRFSEATLVKALEEEGIGRPSTYAAIIYTLVLRNYVTRERGYFSSTELGQIVCDLLVEYFPKVMDVKFTAVMEESLDQIEEGDLDYVKLLSDFYKPFSEELDYAMANIEKLENFVDQNCPECGQQMMVKWGKRGKFLSCSGFPKCKYAQPISTGVACPQEGCSGELVNRRSRNGRSFFGCTNYPQCNFTANKLSETPQSQ